MKQYEKRERPPDDVLVRMRCDLCGRESKFSDWSKDTYEVAETEIEAKIKITQRDGDSYPEGGSGTRYEIDLCPPCFTDRLVPWLREQGAKIERQEWSW